MRIWVDGCFDGMHYGHANALRQAKQFGSKLVVGIHSDKDILHHKGKTVFREEERYSAVLACKWVDEIVRGSSYTTQLEDLEKYDCDFCVHGDDITTTADGSDCYSIVKNAGKYKECKRTEGISTTALVDRMLSRRDFPKGFKPQSDSVLVSELLEAFNDNRLPSPGDKVVYVQGSWDMFHIGHVEFLQKAKSMGDFLLVGVENDDQVYSKTGKYPILDTSERGLGVLACKHADNIILDCTSKPFNDLVKEFKIDLIIYTGNEFDDADFPVEKVCIDPESKLFDLGSDRIINMILDNYEM